MKPPRETYTVRIWWSAEDQCFYADAPDLPGCMSDGPTRGEAVRQIEDAIEAWIETKEENGDPVPLPTTFLQS